MRFQFHPEAEVELNDSVDYYDECQEGRSKFPPCMAV